MKSFPDCRLNDITTAWVQQRVPPACMPAFQMWLRKVRKQTIDLQECREMDPNVGGRIVYKHLRATEGAYITPHTNKSVAVNAGYLEPCAILRYCGLHFYESQCAGDDSWWDDSVLVEALVIGPFIRNGFIAAGQAVWYSDNHVARLFKSEEEEEGEE